MRFRTWINSENSLNASFPEVLAQINKADSTPASAEVIRTGLQPQIDSDQIQTDEKDEQDKIQAIDTDIQNIDSKINSNISSKKISKFKEIWDSLKEKWEKTKLQKDGDLEQVKINGLAGNAGNKDLIQLTQKNPNSTINDLGQISNNNLM